MNVRDFVSRYGREIVIGAVNFLPASPLECTNLHSHFNMLHITYVKTGCGICRVKDGTTRLSPGTIHFVMPGEIHRYTADAAKPYRIYFMHLVWYGSIPDEFPRLMRVPPAERKRFCLRLAELSEVCKSTVRDASWEFRKFGLFSLLMADLLDFSCGTESVAMKSYVPVNSQEARLNYAMKQLYGPPFQFPGVDALAKHCMMSRRKFTTLFKKLTGMSVRQYYLRNVMSYAAGMMEAKELKLKDIAAQCGYSNAQNFLHAYSSRSLKSKLPSAPSHRDDTKTASLDCRRWRLGGGRKK